jgi:disulfide bond formation protein DsbB
MAIYKNDSFIYPYVISLSGVGMAISLFHYLEQKMWEENSLFCQTGAPCKVEYINWFGFITIPLLAFIAFTLILSLMLIGRKTNHMDMKKQDSQAII